jgi:YidC/Oxa1 family membrane protein insertase
MEKRIFIAILISIAFLWLWAAVAPKLFPELAKKPEPPKPVATTTTATTTTGGAAGFSPTSTYGGLKPAPSSATPSPVAAEPVAAERVQQTVIETSEYHAVLSNRGGQIISFKLKAYKRKGSTDPVDLVKAREPGRDDFPFFIQTPDQALNDRLNESLYAVSERTDRGQRVIEYRYSDGRTTATKTFRFGPQPYLFDFAIAVRPPVPYRVGIGPGIRTLGPEEVDTQVVSTGNGVVQRDGKFKVIGREKGSNVQPFPGIEYIGIEDNYFLTVLRPARASEGVLARYAFPVPNVKAKRQDLYAALNAPPDGVVAGEAFFGPKETKLLDGYELDAALQFGWFGTIARFFLIALTWINRFTHNYGFAIIVLTILIKIVLYPLQHKSIVSMKKMQKMQPKTEAIKAKYKKSRTDAEQRQKMNMEMMQLYQKEGINPMAGCLPLVLQLPILWGFYNLLSRAIELRGAPFMLWIQDLSEKDPYYITPILMTATMFIQTYITPATGDPMQRRIFLAMPLFFGFLFKDFPSGLVLYWLVQNVLTIVQQLIMNKWWKDHPDEPTPA